MVSPTLYWSQPGHGPNIHLVLRDRERPRINLLSIQPPIHPFYFPFHSILSIKHRYSRLSRVLSGLSLCWVGSSFVFFPRFHRANDFHRHVPRHCEIKPLTIALIIRGTRGGGLLLEGADGCVALFKRDMGKSIARLSVGNLAWHRRKVFAESRTRSIIYAITTALCFLKRYEKITHAWYSTPSKNRDLYIRLYRYTSEQSEKLRLRKI